jgi:O-antigen/teichoic acid export membrane protein
MSAVSEPQPLSVGSNARAGFTRRVAKGTLANVVRQLLNVVAQIVLVPVLLRFWGDQSYGEWQILAAAVSYMTLLDFGMQTYVVNCMCQCHARGDMQEFTRSLHSALAFSATMCMIAVLVVIPTIAFAPLNDWFQLTITSRDTAVIVSGMIALQTICSLPVGIIGGIYRAVGEYARDITIANIHRVVTLLLTLFIVVAGGGFIAVAAMQLIALVIVLFCIGWDIQRRHVDIRLGFRESDRTLALSFVAPSVLFFLIQISTALAIQGSTLLIGAMCGATAVAVLATLRALVNLVPQAAHSLSSTLWPEFTSFEATGEYGLLDGLHRLGAKLSLLICLCAAVFLHFTGRDIVALWTGNRVVYDQQLMDALLILQVPTSWYLMSSLVLISSNNHRVPALCRIISCISGLSLGWMLVEPMGASGVVLGLAIAEIVISGWLIPWSACRMLRKSFGTFVGDVLVRGACLFVVLYAGGSVVFYALPTAGLERIVLIGVSVGIGSLLLAYTLLLNGRERERVRGFSLARLSVGAAS